MRWFSFRRLQHRTALRCSGWVAVVKNPTLLTELFIEQSALIPMSNPMSVQTAYLCGVAVEGQRMYLSIFAHTAFLIP